MIQRLLQRYKEMFKPEEQETTRTTDVMNEWTSSSDENSVEYDGNVRTTSVPPIAPREEKACYARMEAVPESLSELESDKFDGASLMSTTNPEADEERNGGWDALNFGD